MGLWQRLTGSRQPAEGVAAAPADEVRAALVAVAGPDDPWRVDEGDDGELRALWRLEEPDWQDLFGPTEIDRTVVVRMRLDPERHEVRGLTEQRKVTRRHGLLSISTEVEAHRGQSRQVSKRWTLGGGDGPEETFHFDSEQLLGPLREAALAHGWAWKGVAFGRL